MKTQEAAGVPQETKGTETLREIAQDVKRGEKIVLGRDRVRGTVLQNMIGTGTGVGVGRDQGHLQGTGQGQEKGVTDATGTEIIVVGATDLVLVLVPALDLLEVAPVQMMTETEKDIVAAIATEAADIETMKTRRNAEDVDKKRKKGKSAKKGRRKVWQWSNGENGESWNLQINTTSKTNFTLGLSTRKWKIPVN